MRREEVKKGKKGSKDSKFIEKKAASYPNRYKGELAPKKEIVEEQFNASYDSRYK